MVKQSDQPVLLGQHAPLPASPEEAELDRVPNPHPDTDYLARFTVPEFTSLCPVTGQPDFAHLVIEYVPGEFLVESKSLKLYLGSFRAAAFRLKCSGRRAKSPMASGCRIKAWHPIVVAAETLASRQRPSL